MIEIWSTNCTTQGIKLLSLSYGSSAMVSNAEERGDVTRRSDDTPEDSRSTSSSSGIVTDCSSSNDDENRGQDDCDYIWKMSEELREFAERELGETDEVRSD